MRRDAVGMRRGDHAGNSLTVDAHREVSSDVAARPLWLVRTRFGFVELFLKPPNANGPHWVGRCIYVFDPLTVWALGLRGWLMRDVPRCMELPAAPQHGPWRFVKVSDDELTIDRRICGVWVHVIRFCDRMVQAVGLEKAPNGAIVFPTFN